MEFSPVSAEKIKELRPLFEGAPSNTCDYTPGGLMIWRKHYCTELAQEGESVFFRLKDQKGELFYLCPMAQDKEAALRFLLGQLPSEARFCAVPEEAKPIFEKLCPDAKIICQQEYADYLYKAEDLRTLAGKKYSAQRNHISRFLREYSDWSFAPITEENREAVKAFYQKFWSRYPEEDQDALSERDAIFELLETEDFWGMDGGVLLVAGEPVGFSFGERQGDTLHVHIEKADRRYKGVYQMLTNQYVCTFGKGAEWINREDDMGDEGLRKAKMAYHPIALLKKYLVER